MVPLNKTFSYKIKHQAETSFQVMSKGQYIQIILHSVAFNDSVSEQ